MFCRLAQSVKGEDIRVLLCLLISVLALPGAVAQDLQNATTEPSDTPSQKTKSLAIVTASTIGGLIGLALLFAIAPASYTLYRYYCKPIDLSSVKHYLQYGDRTLEQIKAKRDEDLANLGKPAKYDTNGQSSPSPSSESRTGEPLAPYFSCPDPIEIARYATRAQKCILILNLKSEFYSADDESTLRAKEFLEKWRAAEQSATQWFCKPSYWALVTASIAALIPLAEQGFVALGHPKEQEREDAHQLTLLMSSIANTLLSGITAAFALIQNPFEFPDLDNELRFISSDAEPPTSVVGTASATDLLAIPSSTS